MKRPGKFLIALLILFYFQTGSAFAQIGALINIGGHAALYAARGMSKKEAREEKLIDESSKQEKISGTNVTVLRVKDSDIKSKAKKNIIALQKRLDQYATQYKNNEPLNIPKNDSDLMAIQNIDENWPTEYYTGELRAYKKYALLQKQKAPAAAPADSSKVAAADTTRKSVRPVAAPAGNAPVH